MAVNTRFSVAMHLLTLIELNRYKAYANISENLARSVNTNPVVIRRILSQLKKAGLITVKAGVGGAALTARPEEITLLRIYHAVTPPGDSVFGVHQTSNPRCYVGRNIESALLPPLREAENSMREKLASFTLADIVAPIAAANRIELNQQPATQADT